MDRTLVSDAPRKVGQNVKLYGWVDKRRDHGSLVFFDLWDRSGIIQVVGKNTIAVHPQDVVEVVGEVKKRPVGSENKNLATGNVEIEAQEVFVISKAATLPFDMGGPDLNLELPTLLDWRPLVLRHPKVASIFEMQEAVVEGFRKVAKELGCREVFVPTIVASATEGGAEVFPVKYYEHDTYLAQSPQLYKQMMVPVFERVFTIAHAYRAEPSVTTRHISEVVQMDIEMGFVEFEDLLEVLENVGVSMIKHAEDSWQEVLDTHDTSRSRIPKKIPRLKLREAQELISKRAGKDVVGQDDLSPADEREIAQWALDEHKSDFVTITHFPTAKRAFYTMPDPKNKECSLSYDLLFRGLEIASGSQRINDYNQLSDAIKSRKMNPDNFSMYLQAFKFGMPPEGGFSFGLERITMQILGLGNIREASLFPRDMERVDVRLSSNLKVKSAK